MWQRRIRFNRIKNNQRKKADGRKTDGGRQSRRNPRLLLFVCLFVLFFMCVGLLCGCVSGFHFEWNKEEALQKESYTICEESSQPKRLKELLKERKKKPGSFAYKNSQYTYLVVCYGPKDYSGYSVRVEECAKNSQMLYLRTQLLGPSASEDVVETQTFPYIVVRCARTELLCRIES